MIRVTASYLDGRTAQSRPVTLRFHPDGQLEISGDDLQLFHPRQEVSIDPPLGHTHRFIRLPNDACCEVADHDVLDLALQDWGNNGGSRWIHLLEKSGPMVLVAIVALSFFGWLLYSRGLPGAARHVAQLLPADLTERLGSETLTILDKSIFDPSKLPVDRQEALQRSFQDFLQRAHDPAPYRIVFRHAEKIGANAFALPSGDIVITDGLVALAADDQEIIGVLAHECGHVVHRHALRSMLQNSAIFVVVALVTGDVSSATVFGSALPTYLLESKFSREFETEADLHAVRMMQTAGLDPSHLGHMLTHLGQQSAGRNHAALAYLSTHPPTPERIQAIDAAKQSEAGH